VGEAEEIPLFFTLIPVLALLSNYDQENCLINIGTEGGPERFDAKIKHVRPFGFVGSSVYSIVWPS
jgi:hypothetical protein